MDEIREIDKNLQLKMLAQGNTAEVYLYEQHKILKLFRNSLPHNIIVKEFQINRKIQSQMDNVPKAFEMVSYLNRLGIIYKKVNGTDMIALMTRNPFQFNSYSKQLAGIHARMHEQKIDVGVSVKEKLSFDIMNAAELTEKEKETLIQYLNRLQDGEALCHFDFHPGNVLFQGSEPVVIDWMTGCTGNPAADVARTYLLLQYGELMHVNMIVKIIVHLLIKSVGKIYLNEYMRLTGLTREEMEDWILPVAAARLVEWLTPHERKELLALVRNKMQSVTSK